MINLTELRFANIPSSLSLPVQLVPKSLKEAAWSGLCCVGQLIPFVKTQGVKMSHQNYTVKKIKGATQVKITFFNAVEQSEQIGLSYTITVALTAVISSRDQSSSASSWEENV